MRRTCDSHERMICDEIQNLDVCSRFQLTASFIQHGSLSVYDHSVSVAHVSCHLAERFHLRVDYRSLIRGALLHDYFLYDWHEKAKWHRWHGFRHPYTAWKNAKADFRINRRETNIILRHMFPLTPIPPACREGWLVCVADKICAMEESSKGIVKWFSRRLFRIASLLA
ncbi:MAG: HD domain-containing protein [Sphaerochaetaceae bacterium]|nr:HD domain-containing protein [Sphaerochaetaceae bacterium]